MPSQFTFERSTDYALITSILSIPACYRRMANDSAGDIQRFSANKVPGIEYIVVRWNLIDSPVAVFLLRDVAPNVAEVHFCFRPVAWGATEDAAAAFLEWVWRELGLGALIAPVPSYNRLARSLAIKCGFREWQTTPGIGFRHGREFHLEVLRLGRPASMEVAA